MHRVGELRRCQPRSMARRQLLMLHEQLLCRIFDEGTTHRSEMGLPLVRMVWTFSHHEIFPSLKYS